MVTINEVRDKLKACEYHTSNMRESMVLAERAYNLRLELGITIPAGTPMYTPSTAPAIVDHFVDQIRISNPKADLGALGPGPKNKERRELLRAAARHCLEQLALHEDEPLWEYEGFHLGQLGAACFRVLFNEEAWDNTDGDDEEREHVWPFVTRSVHPANVFVSPGYQWPYAYVIEKQERYLGDLKADYPDWKPQPDEKGYTPDDPVTPVPLLYYWDHDTQALFAGGTEVFQKPNLLGIPPYIWSFSGMGHKGQDGDPDFQAVGITRHVLSELMAEQRQKTAADALWVRMVWPTLVGTISDEEMKQKWGAGPGRYIEVPSPVDDQLKWLETPPINQALYALLPETKRSIEKATYSEVLEGGAGGAEYGTQYGMQVGQARARVEPVKAALERMASRYVAMCLMYWEKVIREPFKVEGKKVEPSDIGGTIDFRIKFENLDPMDNDRRVRLGIDLLRTNAISMRRFLRDYLLIEDVDDEMEERMAEQIINKMVEQGMIMPAVVAMMQGAGAQEAAQAAQGGQQPLQTPRGAPYGPRQARPTAAGVGPTPPAGAAIGM